MKNIIVIIFLLLEISAIAQVKYDNGFYGVVSHSFFEDNYMAEIKNDTLRFYVLPHSMKYGGLGNKPVAICKISQETDSIFKIQSVRPVFSDKIFESMKIEAEVSDYETDSVYVDFYFPNIQFFEYNVFLNTRNGSNTQKTKEKHVSFIIKNSPFSSFTIKPEAYAYSNVQFQYFGVLQCTYRDHPENPIIISKQTSKLTLTIPALTDGYFFQWLINGEFIKFINAKEFEWKNMKFRFLAKDINKLKQNRQWKRIMIDGDFLNNE